MELFLEQGRMVVGPKQSLPAVVVMVLRPIPSQTLSLLSALLLFLCGV